MTFTEAIEATVADLKVKFAQYKRDGLTTKEVFHFVVECMVALGKVAKEYEAIPRRERKAAVMTAMRDLYKNLNPDIPWVPEPFETMIEDIVLMYVAPAIYDVIT